MIINKDALETAKKVLKAYTPEALNSALGYMAFIAPFEKMPEEAKAKMRDNLQKVINNRTTQSEEGS